MLARRLAGILPPLTRDEAVEVTRVWNAAGLQRSPGRAGDASGRSGLRTTLRRGLRWWAAERSLRPGEVSLAHHGVLFLDELPEFSRDALEALRQPLEEGRVVISRRGGTSVFPAACTLVAAMNPCPCGYLGHPEKACRCPAVERRALPGPHQRPAARPHRRAHRGASPDPRGARPDGRVGVVGGRAGEGDGRAGVSARTAASAGGGRRAPSARGPQSPDRGGAPPAAPGAGARQSERQGLRADHRSRPDHRRPGQRAAGRRRARGRGSGAAPRPPAGRSSSDDAATGGRGAVRGGSWAGLAGAQSGVTALLGLLGRARTRGVWRAPQSTVCCEWGVARLGRGGFVRSDGRSRRRGRALPCARGSAVRALRIASTTRGTRRICACLRPGCSCGEAMRPCERLVRAPRVTIVGTRRATAYGLQVDRGASLRLLPRTGVAVVSGMALGVDARAHEAAMRAGVSRWRSWAAAPTSSILRETDGSTRRSPRPEW